ncbi:hypothetical protein [Lysinibacillus piscis]|uniref:Uncharacterized protein n=1 Tax=Lysinibacillus piscis TaxID=2518931 RepID=A0ABQ5NK59_9BACI|nr:hypothetical protein [Lysinibacillus sp. KH24]GLC88655.1 hypothetical protein LYSBPC_17820 [Lysinibacillus sp. KH24]
MDKKDLIYAIVTGAQQLNDVNMSYVAGLIAGLRKNAVEQKRSQEKEPKSPDEQLNDIA